MLIVDRGVQNRWDSVEVEEKIGREDAEENKNEVDTEEDMLSEPYAFIVGRAYNTAHLEVSSLTKTLYS